MKLELKNDKTGGNLLFFKSEKRFDRMFFSRDHFNRFFTIAWNTGRKQRITIDGEDRDFPAQSLVTLLFNQSFSFEKSEDVVAWQFNREFYCIIDHDSEVSCVGFLFNSTDHLFIQLTSLS